MRKTTWLMVAVAVSGLVGVGCGSDDGDGGSNDGPVPTATASQNTPLPTATVGGSAPTATPGGSGVSAQAQAFVGSVVSSVASLADMQGDGSGAGLIDFPVTSPCLTSGTSTIDCMTSGAGVEFSSNFNLCRNQFGATDSFIDGSVTIDSNGSCLNPFPTGQTVTITFVGDIDTSNTDTGDSFSGTLDTVSEVTRLANGTVELDASGTVTSDCVGGTGTFETLETIVLPADGPCPTAGRMSFSLNGDAHEVVYSANGLTIDGQMFDSCEDVASCTN